MVAGRWLLALLAVAIVVYGLWPRRTKRLCGEPTAATPVEQPQNTEVSANEPAAV